MNSKEQKMKLILGVVTALVVVAVVVMVVFFSDNEGKNDNAPSNDATATESVDKKENKPEKKDEAVSEEKDNKQTAKNEKKEEKKKETAEQNQTQEEKEKTFTPLFMYFVTKSDSNYDEYMAVVEELKKEYKGKVEFDIIDIDENPEAKDNFPAEGNTPLLIMNNTKNEISGFGFKCADKAQLKQYIDASF